MPTAPCCCRRMSASRCSCPPSSRASAPTRRFRATCASSRGACFSTSCRLPGLSRSRHHRRHDCSLRDGRVESGSWQASARELELHGDERRALRSRERERHAGARGARLAARLHRSAAHARCASGTRAGAAAAAGAASRARSQIARTTVRAERLPFMAAEFIAGAACAAARATRWPTVPGGWPPTAGVLRDVNFDSGAARRCGRAGRSTRGSRTWN